jgi:hypothetical protein
MKRNLYAIRDSKMNAFLSLVSMRTDDEAKRSLSIIVNDPESLLHRHPNDYELYRLGTLDDESGAITGLENPFHVASLSSLVVGAA